jgi:maleate cis-trans isomerase
MQKKEEVQMGSLKRVGLVVLSDDATSEPDFQMVFTPLGVRVHSARMWRDSSLPAPEWLDRMHEELATASKYVAEVGLNAIAYTCTTGSFYRGVGWDTEMCDIMSEASGVPAFATSPSVADALNEFGAEKISVVTPYPEWNNVRLIAYLEAKGFEVLNLEGHPRTSRGEIREPDHDPKEIFEFAVENCRPEADALLCSCTDWRSLEVVERLEQRLGIPVVSANQATIWLVARQLDINTPIEGFGSLLREHLALVPA